jgi:aquaporin related protein
MALVGALTPLRAALLTVSQILGGITGAALIQALLPGTLNVRTTLSPGTSVVRGLFIEMFLTAMLMLTM